MSFATRKRSGGHRKTGRRENGLSIVAKPHWDPHQMPIEVKSGKSYKRHVALDNLLSSPEYGIEKAYVLSEANVSVEERDGGTAYYLPLYMLPLVAEEARGSSLRGISLPPIDWGAV